MLAVSFPKNQIKPLLLSFFFVAFAALPHALADTELPIAKVLGETITRAQLSASEGAQRTSEPQSKEWLESQAQERLRNLIVGRLMDAFCQSHLCEPTDEEVKALRDFTEASHKTWIAERFRKLEISQEQKQALEQQLREAGYLEQETLLDEAEHAPRKAWLTKQLESPDVRPERKQALEEELRDKNDESALRAKQAKELHDLSPEMQEHAAQQVAHETVRRWKFHRALYRQYGGVVALLPFGIEPIGAYGMWLREQEGTGAFEIIDQESRTAFWSNYPLVQPGQDQHEVTPEMLRQIGESDPFEKPPWWMPATSSNH